MSKTNPKVAQLVKAFSKKSTPGAFMHLSRKTVASQLTARAATPHLINQGNAGLCPSAAVVYGIARTRPAEYVRAVTELFDKGKTKIGRWTLEPDPDLKSYKPPKGAVAEADWIILASIRDSENWFIDYQAVSDNGGAWGKEVAKWLKKAGYTKLQEDWNYVMNKTSANLRKASELHAKNYHVCLLIDTDILKGETSILSRPNHWVVLASNITATAADKPVSMKVYTYGTLRNMPKSTMKLDDFIDYYYGYVAAKY